jgi:6-phosphogluconolactonase
MVTSYPTADDVGQQLANDFVSFVMQEDNRNKSLFIALSGGNTPRVFYEKLTKVSHLVPWQRIHLYWVDERCVPPGHPMSNYGMVKACLLDKVSIPNRHIHQIMGESEPVAEARRYELEIKALVPSVQGIPRFDWMLLGVGANGHTASLFPGQSSVLTSSRLCEVARDPASNYHRITLTARIIVQSKKLVFMATGRSKAAVISHIVNKFAVQNDFPANIIYQQRKDADWYLDAQAAGSPTGIGHGQH